MVLIELNDNFIARLSTLIADYDRESLTNLYQPLIGHTALSLFFTLWAEANNQKISQVSTHENLLKRMQLTTGEFVKAKKALEAIGLLKTHLETIGDTRIFYYDLFAPKSPSEFFNDTLLFGLLIKYIGEVDADKIKTIYQVGEQPVHGEDISASFQEVFNPNYEDPSFLKALKTVKAQGRNKAKIVMEFSYEKLYEELAKIGQISSKALSSNELKELARLATLYDATYEILASIVNDNYNPDLPKGKRLNFDTISKLLIEETDFSFMRKSKTNGTKPNLISSDSKIGNKINLFESVSPAKFLSYLQNGTTPAEPDLYLISYIARKFKLTNPVINVVISYVLETNNNVLSKPYCEKICASLARENITTAIDAMNYLKKTKKPVVSKVDNKPNTVSKKVAKETDEDISWSDLLDSLDGGEEDDGKA